MTTDIDTQEERCIDLEHLRTRTNSNPIYLKEIISIYLEQTPNLVNLMRTSFEAKNWKALSATAHKLIPSFAIMGMNPDFEAMAREIQNFDNNYSQIEEIGEIITQLEAICGQACTELKDEMKKLS